MHLTQNEGDWEVTADGLYIATRDFLMRRGYCCAKRCRNCPYINWCKRPAWQPIPAERVRRMSVSCKAVAGARALLQHHEQQIQQCPTSELTQHQGMIEHYRLLLERWNSQR
jgi:hypothetical protein